ncbi:MAG: IS982 family transposase [Actinobacteria bacterium]|nr:IS982 family transposase [Actinomycetota bacterium]
MHANLDALVTALYVRIDDLLPQRTGPGRRPQITDAELIALAVAQMFLELPNDRKFLALARWRLGHLFPYLPKQSGYNKRLRALTPTIASVITELAVASPSFCDGLRLLDSTPVPCGQSRETARRSELTGLAEYGFCRSHSRYFWGFRLYLLCAPDGMPIAFELAPANVGERQVATEMLARVDLCGYTVMADKGFAGQEFEALMAELGTRFLRPDRKDEPRRNGSLGPVRQWIESVFWTCKGQLTLERHGGRTLAGVCTRVALRLLALAAGLVHNQEIGNPGRHFAALGY